MSRKLPEYGTWSRLTSLVVFMACSKYTYMHKKAFTHPFRSLNFSHSHKYIMSAPSHADCFDKDLWKNGSLSGAPYMSCRARMLRAQRVRPRSVRVMDEKVRCGRIWLDCTEFWADIISYGLTVVVVFVLFFKVSIIKLKRRGQLLIILLIMIILILMINTFI